MATTKHFSLNTLILMVIVGIFLFHGSVESARFRRRRRSIFTRVGLNNWREIGRRLGRRQSDDDDGSSFWEYEYNGPVYKKGTWKSSEADMSVYGLKDYKTRRLYKDSPDKEPSICFNAVSLKAEEYGYFVCPQKDDPDDKAACCGFKSIQQCCKGFKLSSGVIIGLVIGGVLILVVGAVVFVIYKYRSKQRSK